MNSRSSSSIATSSTISLPIAFRKVLICMVSCASSLLSRSTDIPMALNRIDDSILRFRSMLMFKTRPVDAFFTSVRNSSHVPRLGINSQAKDSFPVFSSYPVEKYAPGERTICETMTRSAPLIIKVPVSVISGKSPRKTSSHLLITSPVVLSVISSSIRAFKGAAKLHSRYIDSSALNFGSPNS